MVEIVIMIKEEKEIVERVVEMGVGILSVTHLHILLLFLKFHHLLLLNNVSHLILNLSSLVTIVILVIPNSK